VIPEIHAHLVAAAPNGLTVEYMGWMLKLFDGVADFDPKTGELVMPDRPGLGLAFNRQTVERYAVG
jgi:L-alanine-DL-glutamate epimerase-like enolase superfamily enzyme